MRLCWLKSPDKMDEREGSLTGGCITPHTRNSDSNAAPATGETAQQQTTGGTGETGQQPRPGRDFCGFLGPTKFWCAVFSRWLKCDPPDEGRGPREARPTPLGIQYTGFTHAGFATHNQM